MKKMRLFLPIILVFLVAGCGGNAPPTFTIRPEVFGTNTPFPFTRTPVPMAPTDTLWVPPTMTPTIPSQPTPIPPTSTPVPVLYRVAYVLSDDVLNIREKPGVQNPKVGELAPHARDVQITGAGRQVDPSLWVPIESGAVAGWLNSRFLTGQVTEEEFCQDERVSDILNALKAAVQSQNGDSLAGLIHPERGLRLRQDWSNDEVKLTVEETTAFFTDPRSHDWGRASGSIKDVILPLLETDLVGSAELVCGEVKSGSTSRATQLPFEYQPVNVYAFYRPKPDGDSEDDWGSWAVGIDYWQGLPYLSFLVHYSGKY